MSTVLLRTLTADGGGVADDLRIVRSTIDDEVRCRFPSPGTHQASTKKVANVPDQFVCGRRRAQPVAARLGHSRKLSRKIIISRRRDIRLSEDLADLVRFRNTNLQLSVKIPGHLTVESFTVTSTVGHCSGGVNSSNPSGSVKIVSAATAGPTVGCR